MEGKSNCATAAPTGRPKGRSRNKRVMNTNSRVPTTTDAPGQYTEPSVCGGNTQLRAPGPPRSRSEMQLPDCVHAELLPKPTSGPLLPLPLRLKYAVSPKEMNRRPSGNGSIEVTSPAPNDALR